ncbi:phage tail tube protein [Paenibacillus luteus]|uniref:phage tail tube protein n=1 Tax=Paenibacillus luteus TaxID=2545753 RepID=UPI001143689D|nr:phage tail tube protein [Paenibacillus luteus]
MTMDPTKVISGRFGKLFDADGKWLTNVTTVNATVEFEKEDIMVAGTRWIGKKITGISGSGDFTGYLVTSELIERIGQGTDDTKSALVTELIYSVSDPDNGGTYRVRLKGVTFDSIPLITSEVGSMVENEFPFTFTGYQIMDQLRNN